MPLVTSKGLRLFGRLRVRQDALGIHGERWDMSDLNGRPTHLATQHRSYSLFTISPVLALRPRSLPSLLVACPSPLSRTRGRLGAKSPFRPKRRRRWCNGVREREDQRWRRRWRSFEVKRRLGSAARQSGRVAGCRKLHASRAPARRDQNAAATLPRPAADLLFMCSTQTFISHQLYNLQSPEASPSYAPRCRFRPRARSQRARGGIYPLYPLSSHWLSKLYSSTPLWLRSRAEFWQVGDFVKYKVRKAEGSAKERNGRNQSFRF